MAKNKVYGFNEDGFRRVVKATQSVLRTPTVGSQRRRQNAIIGGGGSSGSNIVVFTVDSYDYQSGVALCRIEYRPYGVGQVINEIPEYEQVEVYDPAGCYFNEPEADLVGRWGTAIYMTPTASTDPYRFPIWVVVGLCCPEA